MSVKKELLEIKNNLEKLNHILLSDVEKKATKCDELEKYLLVTKLKIKNILEIVTDEGKPALKIVYECPQVILQFDDEGNPLENEMFKAINGLNLIDYSDFNVLATSIYNMKIKHFKN